MIEECIPNLKVIRLSFCTSASGQRCGRVIGRKYSRELVAPQAGSTFLVRVREGSERNAGQDIITSICNRQALLFSRRLRQAWAFRGNVDPPHRKETSIPPIVPALLKRRTSIAPSTCAFLLPLSIPLVSESWTTHHLSLCL